SPCPGGSAPVAPDAVRAAAAPTRTEPDARARAPAGARRWHGATVRDSFAISMSEALLEPNGIVTITTDFGTRDAYVGAMKGVMLSISPTLQIHDIAHQIEPQNIEHGATVLRGACPWFPPGSVHVAVVDPGVGTERAPVVIVAGGQAFVGPDNGLFGPVVARLGGPQAAYRLDRQGKLARYLPHRHASTFEGRDLFAPAAAVLAARLLTPADIGRPHDLVQLPG